MNTKSRNAIITGAAGLLGKKHAEALLERGFRVILVDNNYKELVKVKKSLNVFFSDSKIIIFNADITKENKIIKLKKFLKKRKINVDTLINNAAINPKMSNLNKSSSGKLENYKIKSLVKEIEVGIVGAFVCTKVFGADMAKNKFGVIINMGSDLSIIAPDQAVYHKSDNIEKVKHFKPAGYSITKFGLLGLTKYVGTYWAHRGIRCNMLVAGGVENKQPSFLIKNIKKRIPMNRWARADEYKKAIQFLCSEDSKYMTGQTLVIDGGRTAW